MVYIHFPSNLTEEELMLQTKYQKLKKKVGFFYFHWDLELITYNLYYVLFNIEKGFASLESP